MHENGQAVQAGSILLVLMRRVTDRDDFCRHSAVIDHRCFAWPGSVGKGVFLIGNLSIYPLLIGGKKMIDLGVIYAERDGQADITVTNAHGHAMGILTAVDNQHAKPPRKVDLTFSRAAGD